MYYAPAYFKNPSHALTVDLVGCGGTGSQLLTGLARLHTTLLGLGHPGLYVRVFDADVVSPSNIGRQHFIHADIGRNKAVVSVERINRFYGTQWLGIGYKVDAAPNLLPNMLITCVDSVAAREIIGAAYAPKTPAFNADGAFNIGSEGMNKKSGKAAPSYSASCMVPLYWLDTGNGMDFGQVVLGSWERVPPSSAYTPQVKLPTVLERFPDMRRHESKKEQGPSCSLAEALSRQDLQVNPLVANMALALLDKLIRHGEMTMCGAYLNLRTMEMNPMSIPIVPEGKQLEMPLPPAVRAAKRKPRNRAAVRAAVTN